MADGVVRIYTFDINFSSNTNREILSSPSSSPTLPHVHTKLIARSRPYPPLVPVDHSDMSDPKLIEVLGNT